MLVKRGALAFAALSTGVFVMSSAAQAGSFALREQSTTGLGQAFGGAAAGAAGLGSMFWNPATMTAFAGTQFQGDLAGIMPYASATPTTGTSPLLMSIWGTSGTGDVIDDALVPTAYVSHQINDKLWVGLAVNAPFGLLSSYPTNYFGQTYARDSIVRSVDVNPSLGYKVNDWLSVGVGFQAMWFKTELTQGMSPLPYAATSSLAGDDWGFGATAGVTITPVNGTTIGIGYRSAVSLDLSGDLSLGSKTTTLPAGTYPIEAGLTLPDMVSVGITQVITPKLTVTGEFEWMNWSRLGDVMVTGTSGPTAGKTMADLPFRYGDSYYVSAGVNYAWDDKLTLRAGLGYEWSPISNDIRDLRVPDSNRVNLGLGLSYQWNDQLSLDFGYSHLFSVGDGDVSLVPGNPHYISGLPVVASIDSHADIVSIGLTYRFDAPTKTAFITK